MAVEACAFLTHLLLDGFAGQSKEQVLSERSWTRDPRVDAIARGSWVGKSRSEIRSSGFVIDTLEAAMWATSKAADFREAVLIAANLGGDADTVAAVTGQLAGSIWGLEGIPAEWRSRVAWSDRIVDLAAALLRTR